MSKIESVESTFKIHRFEPVGLWKCVYFDITVFSVRLDTYSFNWLYTFHRFNLCQSVACPHHTQQLYKSCVCVESGNSGSRKHKTQCLKILFFGVGKTTTDWLITEGRKMKSPIKIPKQFLTPLKDLWETNDYQLDCFHVQIENHRDSDNEMQSTCKYIIRPRDDKSLIDITYEELMPMIKTGVIPEDFYRLSENCIELNQHYAHSLKQLYSTIQKAFNDHVERTDAILGTGAGEIRP